jgi:uncharacterized protein
MSEAAPASIRRRSFVKHYREALILQRFLSRRRGAQPLRRAIFDDSKRIFQQKQPLSCILNRSESRNCAACSSQSERRGVAHQGDACCYTRRSTEQTMIADIAQHRDELRDLCRRFHVRRLDVFGSAARGDFDPARSDLDFLVEFDSGAPEALSLKTYLGLKDAIETLFARKIDLVDRQAIEASRNYIRKRHILAGAEPIYAA